ncbi:unnamed protein product, partial [Mesorhabditis belari]|uniref:Cdk-activating kinase assembly factor MAT1 centre domain-containing protein n=1 Tax=Mesorhabditis belari TaxID=2138241 RepID=A0AAF3EU44_9BILA
MRECRKCKSSEYTNKNLIMLINECGHPLCKNCVDNLFARNAAPCEVCGKMLKKNNFWEQVFDDPVIEKENFIRKRIRKIYNLREADFPNLREFNDYLERVETIVMNLIHEEDVDGTEKEIKAFQEAHGEDIERNRKKLGPDELWIQQQIREESAMKARLHDLRSTDEFKVHQDNQNIKEAKEVIKELRDSNVAAGLILDRERKRQIEQELEEREEVERRKKMKKDRKRLDGISFAAHRIAGRAYIHKPVLLELNGPPMPTMEEIESSGYLQWVREPSAHRRAGGFTSAIACYRALLEVRLDLFAVQQKKSIAIDG